VHRCIANEQVKISHPDIRRSVCCDGYYPKEPDEAFTNRCVFVQTFVLWAPRAYRLLSCQLRDFLTSAASVACSVESS
jgi:hypothetical protein